MKKVRISYSKVSTYSECGKKYYYQYVEQLEADETHTPLLFGSAIDSALNYLLECKRDGIDADLTVANGVFLDVMKVWHGQNKLVYSKIDAQGLVEPFNDMDVWRNLLLLGYKMILAYQQEIIPLLKQVLEVQTKTEKLNEDGDELVFVLDFIGVTQDGSVVLFDNKTSSRSYPKNSVKDSVQLALYKHFNPQVEKCGYIVLRKDLPKTGKLKIQVIIDTINEDKIDEVFTFLETHAQGIKEERYEKNTKACWSYGRKCAFYDLCHGGDGSKLKRRLTKK